MKKLIVLLTSVLLCLSAFNSQAATTTVDRTYAYIGNVDRATVCEIIKHALKDAQNETKIFNEYSRSLDLECCTIYIAIYKKRKEELRNDRGNEYIIEHYLSFLRNKENLQG